MKHGNNGRLSVWDNAWLIQLIELSMQLTFAKFHSARRGPYWDLLVAASA